MESMSKNSTPCESNDGNEDRLSGLPDEVIVHILSFMPTLDAVRTMLLRRFQNLWTFVPALRFDFDEMICIDDKPSTTHVAFSSFTCFVRNALLLNERSTIDTFRLCIGHLGEEGWSKDPEIIADVQMLLRYAIEREVKDLYFRYNTLYFHLPSCVFTSQYLVTLTLGGCTLKHYEHQSQPQMVNLRNLSLLYVCGSNKAFDQLISGCPCLQELFLNHTFSPDLLSLNINSSVRKLYLRVSEGIYNLNCPSLKILDIAICEPYVKLNMIGVISLQEVNFKDLSLDCDSGEINAYLSLSQNAELISVSCDTFQRISSIEKMEFPQNRCKRIVLHPQWNHERCLEVICMLIRSSINLEELIIYAGESWGNCELFSPWLSTCVLPLRRTVTIDTCVLPLLRTVTIHGNHGYEKWCEGQLQVIEFLLTNAVILEKLVITFGENKLTAVEKFDLVKQVSTFRRASVNATVIFT